ncbi:hypothetical protein [Anaeromyxobacter sp. SG17]|uniref:hypothetical protein n=1 Tax=Anaeromyxobacter sp. SG17 TaxID=2925405 RepID=UPI001F5670D5|nr:hypothetical protein [Anaeromyxobacter sp. SG17]
MLRISWPLALLVAAVIAMVARKPRLFVPVAVVFLVWFLVESAASRRGRSRRR